MKMISYLSVLGESEPHGMTALAIIGHSSGLPDGIYAFYEEYCPAPNCDCRDVCIDIQEGFYLPDGRLSLKGESFAAIRYRWETNEYYDSIKIEDTPTIDFPGAYLDPGGEQSEYAQVFLDIFLDKIEEEDDFRLTFEEHYYNLKFKMKEIAATDRKEIPLGPIDSFPYFARAIPSFRKRRIKLR